MIEQLENAEQESLQRTTTHDFLLDFKLKEVKFREKIVTEK